MNATTAMSITPEGSTATDTAPGLEHESAPAGSGTAPQQPAAAPLPLDNRNANAFAIASFVLGLVSIVAGWSFFAPVTGLVLGIVALRRGTGERTLALWGVWLNGVLLALTVLLGVVLLTFFGFGIIAAAAI